MSVSIEKTGTTVTEAVEAALAELGVSIDDVVVEVLEEGSFEQNNPGNRPARVLVTAEDDRPRYFGDDVDQNDHEQEDIISVARNFVEQITASFALPCAINLNLHEDVLDINIEGTDCGIIIGRGGETLSALQYLTSLIVNNTRTEPLHVHLDVAGYKKRHEDNLTVLARKTASRVARANKIFEMKPMSPADRRIIHFALQNFRGVETYSEGEGENRRVIIAPKHHD